MPAPSAGLCRSFVVRAFVPVALLLSSCTDTTPISPAADLPQEQSFSNTQKGRIAIQVAGIAKLLNTGDVEVRVRAVCSRGYVREESGLLRLEQGFAAGEGSVQLHLGGCTGRWQSGTVRVFSFGEPFRRGRARVLFTFAVVNPNDPTGMDQLQASVDKTLRIR